MFVTPFVGVFGPFDNGNGTASMGREYFLPAGFVFGTVWAINYLGLAAYGVWQALPGQRDNQRVRRALPWLAGMRWETCSGLRLPAPWKQCRGPCQRWSLWRLRRGWPTLN